MHVDHNMTLDCMPPWKDEMMLCIDRQGIPAKLPPICKQPSESKNGQKFTSTLTDHHTEASLLQNHVMTLLPYMLLHVTKCVTLRKPQ